MNPAPNETRILLVDDHQIMRQGLRGLIATQPGLIVVGEAADGRLVVDQVRTLVPHLVLMDMHLPDKSGVEVARQLLAEFSSVKVVALSADSTVELVLQALRVGISGFIVKENGSDELFRAIHTVMDHRLYLSSSVSSEVILKFLEPSGPAPAKPVGLILSERERLLLRLVAAGKRNKEISVALAVTVKSVETYRSRLQKKLGCASTADLIRYAIREGIVQA